MSKAFFTMKTWKPFTLVVCLLSAGGLQATQGTYVNDGIVTSPPMVDATNFVNNGTFQVFTFDPYQTFNTENYTNRGSMSGFAGLDFRTHPNPYGPSRMATSFESTGTLDTQERIIIGATNIVLRSTTTLPDAGLLELSGDAVDASRSVIAMGATAVAGPGTPQTQYWGVGTNNLNPGNLESLAVTPAHDVDTRTGASVQTLFLPEALSYVQDSTLDSNRTVRVAFVQDISDPSITTSVYFTDDEIVVEWLWEAEDPITLETTTNVLYLRDDFGSSTNLAVFPTNGSPRKPVNYTLETATEPDAGLPDATVETTPPGVFDDGRITNEYSAFGVEYTASTQPLSPVGGIANLGGRVKIAARETLDLKLARIAVPNYLSIAATNHFEGAQGAKILSVYTDLNLATTNGSLTIENLLLPSVPRLVGTLEMYSARWTTQVDGVTNDWHVLFVDSAFQNGTPALVANLRLQSDDAVVISDELNILSNAVIDAQSLTLTAAVAGGSSTNGGGLNFLDSSVIWSSALPSLQLFTNQGTFTAPNAVYFGSATAPYQSFVNSGDIFTSGTLLWADYFENQGSIGGFASLEATFGDAVLSNGTFVAFNGDIRLSGESLVVSNHELAAGRELRLDIAGLLDDGGPGNDNQWSAGVGLNGGVRLMRPPAEGDLLGTTIRFPFEDPAQYEETPIVWAGQDRGCNVEGFETNAALKGLVLDGGQNDQFQFSGVAAGSALYVETLTLLNYATNVGGVFSGIAVDPSITVYYAQAFADGTDVSETLNGALDGGLCWVSNYAGAFSFVAIAYSQSETVVMNASLAASSSIDSDADGVVNSADATPLYTGSQVDLKLGLTAATPAKPLLTWATLPGAQNVVLFKDSIGQAGWSTLTNFVSTSNSASAVDEAASSGSRLYRVQVSP